MFHACGPFENAADTVHPGIDCASRQPGTNHFIADGPETEGTKLDAQGCTEETPKGPYGIFYVVQFAGLFPIFGSVILFRPLPEEEQQFRDGQVRGFFDCGQPPAIGFPFGDEGMISRFAFFAAEGTGQVMVFAVKGDNPPATCFVVLVNGCTFGHCAALFP
jgi:hypothetical protein